MHVIACIEDPVVIENILAHLDSKTAGGVAGRWSTTTFIRSCYRASGPASPRLFFAMINTR
jgi:hypothetical protein